MQMYYRPLYNNPWTRCSSREFLHRTGVSHSRVQRPLVPPPRLVQCCRHRTKRKQGAQVRETKSLSLEDTLEEGHVDERELHQERRGDRRDQHPVLREAAPESTILYRRDEVEEYKASKCL